MSFTAEARDTQNLLAAQQGITVMLYCHSQNDLPSFLFSQLEIINNRLVELSPSSKKARKDITEKSALFNLPGGRIKY